jgi:parallel beta-helix repeat protein
MIRNVLATIRNARLGPSILAAFPFILLCTPSAKAGTTITQSTCPVLIAQSGDYSLGTDVGPCMPSVDGIDIMASNVTLRLNGHTISGTATSGTCNSSNGIYVMGTSLLQLTMVHVLGSGTISNFVIGFRADNSAGSFVKFTTVTAGCPFFNSGFLIQASSQWKLEGNVVRGTPSSFGILLRGTADNDLVRNDVNDSIVLVNSSNNTIVNNTANDGGGLGGIAVGVFGGGNNNEIHANTTNNNTSNGLHLVAGSGNNVTGNTSLNNLADDMRDDNPNCDGNKWEGNKFNTSNQPCIH